MHGREVGARPRPDSRWGLGTGHQLGFRRDDEWNRDCNSNPAFLPLEVRDDASAVVARHGRGSRSSTRVPDGAARSAAAARGVRERRRCPAGSRLAWTRGADGTRVGVRCRDRPGTEGPGPGRLGIPGEVRKPVRQVRLGLLPGREASRDLERSVRHDGSSGLLRPEWIRATRHAGKCVGDLSRSPGRVRIHRHRPRPEDPSFGRGRAAVGTGGVGKGEEAVPARSHVAHGSSCSVDACTDERVEGPAVLAAAIYSTRRWRVVLHSLRSVHGHSCMAAGPEAGR